MDDETARDMNRLLARGKLSGPEADAILERVLHRVPHKQPRPVRRIAYWLGPVLAAAATVMLLVYVPRGPHQDVQIEEGGMSSLRVTCSPGTLTACPTSSSLVFSLEAKNTSGFLSAYAEPIDGGERIWLASKEDGSTEMAATGSSADASKRIVRLPAPAKPGRYRVHAVLADRPLARAEIDGALDVQNTRDGVIARVRVVVVTK